MAALSPRLFDFSPFVARREEAVGSIREFLAHAAFRSAVVEELVLDEDFYRRPLRPEDLEILPFAEPVRLDTVNALSALAGNRMLLSIYELSVARLPRSAQSESELARFAAFYGDDNQTRAALIRPFLENFAFDYAGNAARPDASVSDCLARLREIATDEAEFWQGTLGLVTRRDYLRQGLTFGMIQRWSLAPAKRTALARAQGSGYFDGIEASDLPSLCGTAERERALSTLAKGLGIDGRAHSYWQFYLATSLAQTNLLYCLSSRPDRALSLYGAAFAAEVEWVTLQAALEKSCPHLVGAASTSAESDVLARFERVLRSVESRFGQHGIHQVALGLGAAKELGARARWDLGEQLSWLSAVGEYCRFARRIDTRVQAECPDIDRETFVEPREMCSTTHVHNDHRLVVIEAGDMVFWGNLGMQLKMKVGDMVLIPQGRLHGSTVVSAECTYHQPIIPDDWVSALTRELNG
jgi:hypothetical protein